MNKRKSLSSIKEARKRLGGISHGTIYKMFAVGKLTARKVAGRTMVDDDEIDELIQGLPSAIDAGTIRYQPQKERAKPAC